MHVLKYQNISFINLCFVQPLEVFFSFSEALCKSWMGPHCNPKRISV
jgi:hypothetical protein